MPLPLIEIEKQIQLRQDVELVYGAKRAALYDLNAGNVYSINADAAKIITGEVSDVPFWETLKSLGLVEDEC